MPRKYDVSFWKTSKFRRLQKRWELRLEQSGFDDVEKHDGRPGRSLERVSREAQHNYFRELSKRAFAETYEYPVERLTMLCYCSGLRIFQIVKALEKAGYKRHRQTIRKIIQHYEKRWGLQTKRH